MRRSRLSLIIIILIVGLLIWQLPAILKSIPSRYVAAYLPEPIQELAEREHVEILPTAAIVIDAATLIEIGSPLEGVVLDSVALDESADTSGQDNAVQGGADQKRNNSAIPSDDSLPMPSPQPSPTSLPPIPTSSRLVSFNHQFQTWNNCGPATLAMGLSFFGLNINQKETATILKPNPEDRNVSPGEMEDYVNLKTDLSAISRANGDIDLLKRFVANGYPVIVELGLDPPGEYRWMGWYGHYLLIVAYDDASQQFWVYDSWFGTSEVPAENADTDGREINYGDLDRYWRQFNRSYIVLSRPEQANDLERIIGTDMVDEQMWLRALSQVQTELKDEPDQAFLWFNLGSIYNELEEYEMSAAAFDQARSIGLPWRMLWYQFGPYEAYYQIGRYEDVIVLADVTLQDRPYFEESYFYMGLALDALGQDDQALSSLERAVRFNPNFEPAALALEDLESRG